MPTFSAADCVLIHRAIHECGPDQGLVETSRGEFVVEPTKFKSATVFVPTDDLGASGATFVGANPQKTSRFGNKARAGGAITFINPGMSKGYEPACTVLESLTATGAVTISENHGPTQISGLAEADVTEADTSRQAEPEKPPPQQGPGEGKKPKNPNGKTITCVEPAKSGRAKCKECRETIEKGELRVGSANNYRGTPCTDWRKASCVTTLTVEQIQKLDGYEALSENHKNQLLGVLEPMTEPKKASIVVD